VRVIIHCFSLFLPVAASVSGGEVEELIKAGNAAFRQEQYSDALEQYQIAETEIPESPELDYNIAGVLHHQEKYEEALEKYNRSLNSQETSLHSRTKYNLGNTHYRMGDFAKAIENFQQALESNPDDLDAKFNLELARKMLKEQIKPEEQESDENNQQQQEQQQQEQDQEQEQEQEQNQDQDQQDQQEPQDQQQQEQQEAKPISKEDAERILNALKDDEQDVQKKIKRQVSGGDYTGNDW
jgi:tetratricopeptide (TPR) repeat protein